MKKRHAMNFTTETTEGRRGEHGGRRRSFMVRKKREIFITSPIQTLDFSPFLSPPFPPPLLRGLSGQPSSSAHN
jgi:hypothetical protein